MDTATLVTELKQVFDGICKSGIVVTYVALVPVYSGLDNDSYILAVSAPSLKDLSEMQKIRSITKPMYATVSSEALLLINRVHVYASENELKTHIESDFGDWNVDYRVEEILIGDPNPLDLQLEV